MNKKQFSKIWNNHTVSKRLELLDKANAWGFAELNANTKFKDLTPHVQNILLNV